jgi:hypothetical protein
VVASISRTVSAPPSLINADFVLDLVPCPSMEKDVRAAVIRLDEAEAAIGTNCVTTGSARSSARHRHRPLAKAHRDAAIEEENRTIDRKVNSICRDC